MKVTFDNAYSAFQVIAPKGTMISYTATPTAIADGVYVIGDEGSICIDDQLTDTLYLSTVGSDYTVTGGQRVVYPLGDTSVIIRGNISTVPFKSGGKGGGGSGDGTHYKGTTTTALTDGSTTNPITILIEDEPVTYTAVMGDIVVYGSSEFIFDSNAWKEIGRGVDTTPTSGSVNFVTSDGIYKNTAGQKYYSYNTLKGEIFNEYTRNKASGATSHAEGYSTTASNSSSHAEGAYTTASGVNSHAEGYETTASGIWSHTEGGYTTASANCSHAEGSETRASGQNSHAEGDNAKATGQSSHAEGFSTTASGECSHAGGWYTAASGQCSHAGGFWTQANQQYMTAIGKYNSPRTGDLFNIGNGTANNARSNIVEVNQTSMNVNGNIRRDGIGIDDYTTTERKIGKWIDGSDLYQRTFDNVTISANGQWNENVLGTSGIEIVDIKGLCKTTTDTKYMYPLNYYRNTDITICTCLNESATDINIRPYMPSDATITAARITILYTKPSVQSNLMQTPIPTEEVSETPIEEEDMR